MILQRLRSETGKLHQALEQRLPLIDAGLSRFDYESILERFYGYYLPFETRLSALQLWGELGFDFANRRKVPHLEKDLQAFGKTAGQLKAIPRCDELPDLDSVPQALGCLYVLEGSTLGGQVITRHLLANLGLTPETGAAFFAGYGTETGARWQAFCAMLTAAAGRFGGEDQIVASANQTFETMGNWLFREKSIVGNAL